MSDVSTERVWAVSAVKILGGVKLKTLVQNHSSFALMWFTVYGLRFTVYGRKQIRYTSAIYDVIKLGVV